MENTQASAEVVTPATAKPELRETRRRPDIDPDDGTASLTGGGAGDVGRRLGRRRQRGSPPTPLTSVQPLRPARSAGARTALAGFDEWRRLERDLHDGVQNELVALIVKLALAEKDPQTPPALAEMLTEIEAGAQAALDALRNIAHGIHPPVLADLGVDKALRALVARAAIDVVLRGAAPGSTQEAEEAVYFCCSEAIQNTAKHVGPAAHVDLSLRHHPGRLVVSIADDGPGFDPAQTPTGAGLQNIRDRIQDLGGTFTVASNPGPGTILMISLPWPPPAGATP